MPAPYAPNQMQQPLPALYLYPLNDSFLPKHIHLPQGPRVKIGRQTNVKTAPGERNGFFDSKVLSRQHAEVWEENGKIYIKDVKSSNGTFINGERLSPEGAESDPFELKTDDIVEFGIDIVGEDNKTIIHHKVAARVVCVFTEQDAQSAARAEQHQNPPLANLSSQPNGSGSAFNFAGSQGPGPGQSQRRPAMQQQALAGMGGMGGNMRPPGKSGLTFDHILNRLQGELQKTRETGAELHSLTGAMSDIHETLGGNLPQLPPYPQSLPPVMPPQPSPPQATDAHPNGHSVNASSSSSALAELQAQLQETQMSLATHMDKIRSLEGMLAEHEAIKREVSTLREMMEDEKRELEMVRGRRRSNTVRADDGDGDGEEGEFVGGHHDDDDDARSIATVTPHELERVEEEDEEQLAAEQEEEERRQQQREGEESMTRPRTPEPTGMGIRMDDEYDGGRGSRSPSPPQRDRHAMSNARENDMTDRLNHLSTQLESALELSRALQVSHATAQTTISLLESKVTSLESLVQASQTQVAEVQATVTETREEERKSLSEMVKEWKKGVEGQWSGVREEWREERERLNKAREEWERRVVGVEEGVTRVGDKVEKAVASLAQQQQVSQNGNARPEVGLVTPPSPRSLSSDSGKQRSRRKRSTASRGRPRSNSAGSKQEKNADADADVDAEGYTSSSEGATLLNDGTDDKASSIHRHLQGSRTRSPWMHDDSEDEDADRRFGGKGGEKERKGLAGVGKYPITPESSVRKSSTGSMTTMGTEEDGLQGPASADKDMVPMNSLARQNMQYSTAVGVIVLSVAAAAVLWRVKAE